MNFWWYELAKTYSCLTITLPVTTLYRYECTFLLLMPASDTLITTHGDMELTKLGNSSSLLNYLLVANLSYLTGEQNTSLLNDLITCAH